MPRLAFALCLLGFLCLFGLRSLLQWRRTGSTGLKGFHGAVGSLPWLAGVTVSLGLVLTLLAPLAALQGWPGCGMLLTSPPVHATGAVLAALGGIAALVAQLSMGDSWRVGVDETETTELVTAGVFAWVRNPIFTSMGVCCLGLVLLVPSLPAGAALLLTLVGIEIQVRAVEEPYLAATHGERYAEYRASVGRFLPGIGRVARS